MVSNKLTIFWTLFDTIYVYISKIEELGKNDRFFQKKFINIIKKTL